jgi:hypothetical protein
MGLTSPGTLPGGIVSIFSDAKAPFIIRKDKEVGKVRSMYTWGGIYSWYYEMVKDFPLAEPKQSS